MENYETLGVIGEGTYGVVMRARHRETGQVVAIKKFKESDEDEQVRKTSLREVRVLKQLRHDNIITLLEVFRRKGKLYLVFEYVERTILEVLESKPSGLDEDEVRRYMYQLLRGVEYCHAMNVMHRDIKPENILISRSGSLKLCDFGFARMLSIGGKYTDYVATRWYRGPELLVGDVEYTKEVDIWAIGCIFAEISNGMPLFPGESDVDQLSHIMRCTGKITTRQAQTFRRNPLYVGVELPNPKELETLDQRFPNVPRNWIQFLKACLKNDPELRHSCTALMNLPYFTDNGFRTEFEHELQILFEQEHRALQGIGNSNRATNKTSRSSLPQTTSLPHPGPSASPVAPQPDAPISNPVGRNESPTPVVGPPSMAASSSSKATGKQQHQAPPVAQDRTVPTIGALWTQYLASTTAPPTGHHGVDHALPDLGHKVQALQTQHPAFAGGGAYYRGENPTAYGASSSMPPTFASYGHHHTSSGGDAKAGHGSSGTHAGYSSHFQTQPAQQPSLSMTSTALKPGAYQPPSSSQASRPMFPSLGGAGAAPSGGPSSSSGAGNPSLGLYKKKAGAKKNVLSTLNLGSSPAYAGSQPVAPQGVGAYQPNPYVLGGAAPQSGGGLGAAQPGPLMLHGHHAGQPPPSQQGPRRTSKPWGS